jgi:peroxiredoxin Q/BCP
MTEELDVGSPAPDFVLPANSGGEVRLFDYRGKALVVLFFVREYN